MCDYENVQRKKKIIYFSKRELKWRQAILSDDTDDDEKWWKIIPISINETKQVKSMTKQTRLCLELMIHRRTVHVGDALLYISVSFKNDKWKKQRNDIGRAL